MLYDFKKNVVQVPYLSARECLSSIVEYCLSSKSWFIRKTPAVTGQLHYFLYHCMLYLHHSFSRHCSSYCFYWKSSCDKWCCILWLHLMKPSDQVASVHFIVVLLQIPSWKELDWWLSPKASYISCPINCSPSAFGRIIHTLKLSEFLHSTRFYIDHVFSNGYPWKICLNLEENWYSR